VDKVYNAATKLCILTVLYFVVLTNRNIDMYPFIQSGLGTRAIRKVISGEILTKQAMRKNIYYIQK
jgi:hypothetical protein